MIHNDVWRHLHNQHRFNYQQDSCCTVGETHGWHDGPHRCDVVQEGERVQSEADESGNRLTLVTDAASWESARSECINQNGKIANIQTEAQFEQVLTLMRETGVANAWICNEVAAPGDGASTGLVGEFQAWGSDVTIPAGGSGEPDRLQTTLLSDMEHQNAPRPCVECSSRNARLECSALSHRCGEVSQDDAVVWAREQYPLADWVRRKRFCSSLAALVFCT